VTPYQNEGKEGRMVCDIQVIDGQLVSEDNVVMRKLAELGFDVWLDPKHDLLPYWNQEVLWQL
jgi:hypothetical protein